MHVAPRRFGWGRRALFRLVERACVALGGRALYRRRCLDRLETREEVLDVPGLHSDLEGLTLGHLSDIHAGAFLRRGDLRTLVRRLEELAPDVIAITGDLCVHRVDEAFEVLDELTAYRPPLGTFAVFGNHDYKQRREGELVQRLSERGVVVLRNAGVRVPVGGAVLALTGIEDLEEGKVVDPVAARADLEPGDLEIMLCHNAGGAPHLARPGCAAILSGHSHGGQIDLPILRWLGPPHPGVRVPLGPTQLIVSRGIGALGVPLRVGAPAEIVLVRLRRA
ncbi:MAG: metallophosphoesterase [Planctomycetota bacterium]|nr:metallophosphoesterase [Planctomycetota bacterium]